MHNHVTSQELRLPVPNFEGRYEVSDWGRVRSLDHTDRRGQKRKGRFLSSGLNRYGYPQVGLSLHGKLKTFTAHRLVLTVFVGPRLEGMQCCHNDGVKANNHLSNLRWDTCLSNMRDKAKHGTQSRMQGELHGQAVLIEQDIREIRARCANGESQRTVARSFGIGQTQVSRIVTGKRWAHID